MRASWPGVALAATLLALASCTTTTDSIGYNASGGVHLRPVTGPATYPNPFKNGLNKSDAEIANKIAAAFNQLFYGDAGLEAIYVPMGTDQASIQDTLHGDVRTEGIGLAMMIAIQLDKRSEFDRLWTFAETRKKQMDGPRRGYFESSCDGLTGTEKCDDPFGESQMVTALLFANDRWGSGSGPINYEAGAVDLLSVMRHKQDENGGIVDGITDTFDSETALPFAFPVVGQAGVGRPSIVMPAYYDLWAQATGDPFWTRAAAAGRDYWKRTVHPTTGLMPLRANFDGTPYANWENYGSECYRAQVNMALDWAWAKGAKDTWEVDEADRLLQFFTSKGMNAYGSAYSLDGITVVDSMHDFALVAVNGVTGMVAPTDQGRYVTAVWDMATPTGQARYYSGILYMTSLLILSGQYRVW